MRVRDILASAAGRTPSAGIPWPSQTRDSAQPFGEAHPRLNRLRTWLDDGQYDSSMTRSPNWVDEWRMKVGYAIEVVGLWAICRAVGHDPVQDQCRMPEHDYCATCRKLTPGRARDRSSR